jgi:hypothetical protein
MLHVWLFDVVRIRGGDGAIRGVFLLALGLRCVVWASGHACLAAITTNHSSPTSAIGTNGHQLW